MATIILGPSHNPTMDAGFICSQEPYYAPRPAGRLSLVVGTVPAWVVLVVQLGRCQLVLFLQKRFVQSHAQDNARI